MTNMLGVHGGARGLAKHVGLSEPTVRKIADTGIVTTHATAAKLSIGSGGTLPIEDALQPDGRGAIYQVDPGLSILQTALRDRVSVTDVLNRIGIDHHDLWAYMNHRNGTPGELRGRVQSALDKAGIPASTTPETEDRA